MYVKCAAEMICVGLFSRFCSGFVLLEFFFSWFRIHRPLFLLKGRLRLRPILAIRRWIKLKL